MNSSGSSWNQEIF
jgi:hypothetical protein